MRKLNKDADQATNWATQLNEGDIRINESQSQWDPIHEMAGHWFKFLQKEIIRSLVDSYHEMIFSTCIWRIDFKACDDRPLCWAGNLGIYDPHPLWRKLC